MVTNAREFVQPPVFTPTPYGLLSVVEMRADAGHWQAGVTWEDVCGGSSTYVDYCLTSAPAVTGSGQALVKTANTGRTIYGATPFTVVVEIDCSPVDFYENQDAVIAAALARYESYEVERTFWTGAAYTKNGVGGVQAAVLPHLAHNATITETSLGRTIVLQQAATVVTGVGVNIVTALGLLESALAACLNGVGVIHVPQGVAPVMAGLGLIRGNGNQFRTINGNLVAIGAGYTGTGPGGVTPGLGQGWIFATSPVFMYRSAPRLLRGDNGNIDRSVNTIKAIIERDYLLGYDCCLFAVKVNDASVIAVSTTTP